MYGEVRVVVTGVPDAVLEHRVTQLHSAATLGADTFRKVFERDAGKDMGVMFKDYGTAFAPRKVTLVSAESGNKFTAGELMTDSIGEAWNPVAQSSLP